MKVQRTSSVLRDSLEPGFSFNHLDAESKAGKATVENEEGESVEVLFDPVLKCYYDPKSNTYYELLQK